MQRSKDYTLARKHVLSLCIFSLADIFFSGNKDFFMSVGPLYFVICLSMSLPIFTIRVLTFLTLFSDVYFYFLLE